MGLKGLDCMRSIVGLWSDIGGIGCCCGFFGRGEVGKCFTLHEMSSVIR